MTTTLIPTPCYCGKPGYARDWAKRDAWWCLECQNKRLENFLDEKNQFIGKLLDAIAPKEMRVDFGFEYEAILKKVVEIMTDLRKQPHILERVPGIKPKEEPTTCDVGMDWED